MKLAALLIKLALVGCVHCAIGVLLYRGRVVNRMPGMQSDFLVFILPALLALVAYGACFWSSRLLQAKPAARIVTLLVISILAVWMSSWLFMLVAFNKYGT